MTCDLWKDVWPLIHMMQLLFESSETLKLQTWTLIIRSRTRSTIGIKKSHVNTSVGLNCPDLIKMYIGFWGVVYSFVIWTRGHVNTWSDWKLKLERTTHVQWRKKGALHEKSSCFTCIICCNRTDLHRDDLHCSKASGDFITLWVWTLRIWTNSNHELHHHLHLDLH